MHDDRDDTSDKGFKVVDRRQFTTEGEARPEAEEPPPREEPQPGARPRGPLPEIDFGTFILSLSTSALYHLGEMPHPDTNAPEQNLPLAKQTIDIIGMLREKTKGNLTEDEAQLLENLLYDLRMKYVDATRK